MPKTSHKNISFRKFKKWMVIKIEKKFYINRINLNQHIVFKGIKFYNIERKELKKEGYKFKKVIREYSELENNLIRHEVCFYFNVYKEEFQLILENYGYKFKKD